MAEVTGSGRIWPYPPPPAPGYHRPMPDTPTAPPAPLNLSVASGDGHQSELLFWRGDSARPGLLWLPALGVPARKYRHFATALAECGCRVALHEWRGQDTSNRRAGRGSDWNYACLLADIAASRRALKQAEPATRWLIGGHSLGAQLAALALAQVPQDYAGYVLVGSGQPWWRGFPGLHKLGLLGAIAGFHAFGALFGYFPGDRVGFGGREARSVMRDWARSAWSGDYRPEGLSTDFEQGLRALAHPALILRLASDTYAPRGSLQHLLEKLPRMKICQDEIGDAEFSGGKAGHFEWMREPQPVVRRLCEWLDAQATIT
jgi:predicted alpha/beta hydrolase